MAAKKRLWTKQIGHDPNESNYIGRRMDFFGRSIPFFRDDTIESALERWIRNGTPKSSPWYLAQKAVIAVYPEHILGIFLDQS